MKKKIIWGFIALLLVAGGLWQGRSLYLPTKVETVSLTEGPAVDAVYATGTVEPGIMVPIAPRTSSRLILLNADEGQDVKKDTVLAQMEDTELQAAITELQAKLEFAESDLRRKETLYQTKSISKDIYDTAKTARDTVKAQIDAAKAKANYFQLVAPADGRLIKRDGEVGEVIAAGTPVFYFTCCAPLRISAEVDEESIADVKIGQDVLIQSDNFKGKVFHGKVSSITPKGDPVSRSYRVRIALDDSNSPFMVGMTTETNIILTQKDKTSLLPTVALGPKNAVQKIENNHVVMLTPVIGIKGTERTEIISGINQGDYIVTPYNPDLEDGQRVRISKRSMTK